MILDKLKQYQTAKYTIDALNSFIDENPNFPYNNKYINTTTLYSYMMSTFNPCDFLPLFKKLAAINVPFFCYDNVDVIPYLSRFDPNTVEQIFEIFSNIQVEHNLYVKNTHVLGYILSMSPTFLLFSLQLDIGEQVNSIHFAKGDTLIHYCITHTNPLYLSQICANKKLIQAIDPNILSSYGDTPFIRGLGSTIQKINLDSFVECFKDRLTLGNVAYYHTKPTLNNISDIEMLIKSGYQSPHLVTILKKTHDKQLDNIVSPTDLVQYIISHELVAKNDFAKELCKRLVEKDKNIKDIIADTIRSGNMSCANILSSETIIEILMDIDMIKMPHRFIHEAYTFIWRNRQFVQSMNKNQDIIDKFIVVSLNMMDHDMLEDVLNTADKISFSTLIDNALSQTSAQCKKIFLSFYNILSDRMDKQYIKIQNLPGQELDTLYDSCFAVRDFIDKLDRGELMKLFSIKNTVGAIRYCSVCTFAADSIPPCGHFICGQCLTIMEIKLCPLCRESISLDQVIEIH